MNLFIIFLLIVCFIYQIFIYRENFSTSPGTLDQIVSTGQQDKYLFADSSMDIIGTNHKDYYERPALFETYGSKDNPLSNMDYYQLRLVLQGI